MKLKVRSIALLSTLLLLAAACGQKEGVHVTSDTSGGQQITSGGTTGGGGELGEQAGDGGGGGGQAIGSGTSGGGATGTTGGSGGAEGGTSGGTDGGGGGGQPQLQPQGSDRTGVTDDAITLAIHAPVTGAAPLPATSFRKFGDLYWRQVTDRQGETVLGRSDVEVLFRDDKYQPASARQVCRELASEAFFLVGGGGTDQIQACANFANEAELPYFSAGVTERGLRGLPWYYTVSMSYKQQGDLLAQYVAKEFPGKTMAMIATDTANFDDAVEGLEAGVQRHGVDYYKTLRHPKGDTSWYNSFGNELKQNGVEVVYLNTAPTDYIQFAQQNSASGGGPGFQYVGVGITSGLNAVLPTGCPDIDRGTFLSPFPGLDWARDNLPQFFEAGRELEGEEPDDIALALWVVQAAQHEMFKRYGGTFGNDLTREDFRALVEQQQGLRTGVGPELNYTPDDHFGASSAHLIRADCGKGEHVTLDTFVTGF